jgi:hypothetical protein
MEITSFDEIQLNSNTLIICDIDNVLLKIIKPPLLLSLLCYCWCKDKQGFKNLLKKIRNTQSEICFLTSRQNNKKIINYTKMDFDDIGLYYSQYEVFHCGNIEKGNYILSNINIQEYDYIIFY